MTFKSIFSEREVFTRRLRVDMRQAAKSAEAMGGVAGYRDPDMARLKRGGRRIALADRDERLMSAASSFVCGR
ncbi:MULTISPECIES: hypothetical protein [unclassified Bradyrhizobium]|uniref:hypothetical protein n=1 Tax=Bradyrhizobium sp. USDA 4541 TaxID=2817704 RepID=UPI0020A44239|nr:hypothetical protein [Bradyrhizobium sp. USDA 4541]MCP1850106.1 hypothetical protein [Bradyrhizobium sp. USDA 4541]